MKPHDLLLFFISGIQLFDDSDLYKSCYIRANNLSYCDLASDGYEYFTATVHKSN